MNAGRSFVSVSDEVFYSDTYDVSPYEAIDIIFGEEKSTSSIYDKSVIDYKIYTTRVYK